MQVVQLGWDLDSTKPYLLRDLAIDCDRQVQILGDGLTAGCQQSYALELDSTADQR